MSAIVVVYGHMKEQRIMLPLEIEEKDDLGTLERDGAAGPVEGL